MPDYNLGLSTKKLLIERDPYIIMGKVMKCTAPYYEHALGKTKAVVKEY